MNITKPIAPDTLIERLRKHAEICGIPYARDSLNDAADRIEANNRQLQLCRDIADKVLRQAECLEGYAVKAGFEAGPVPSVFHLQASHFRTYANELRASIEGVGE